MENMQKSTHKLYLVPSCSDVSVYDCANMLHTQRNAAKEICKLQPLHLHFQYSALSIDS